MVSSKVHVSYKYKGRTNTQVFNLHCRSEYITFLFLFFFLFNINNANGLSTEQSIKLLRSRSPPYHGLHGTSLLWESGSTREVLSGSRSFPLWRRGS